MDFFESNRPPAEATPLQATSPLKNDHILKIDRENSKHAAQFLNLQYQNAFVIQNETPLIHFGLNMHATGHAKLTIKIL